MSITSSGADVTGIADRFSFVYRPITGNATIIARIASLPAASASAQAGIMIRESLQSGSRHAYVLTSVGGGTMFRRRTTTSGSTAQTGAFDVSSAGGGAVSASWLKLQRAGSVLTAWWSDDGVVWQTIGTATITLPSTAYVGLAVASGTATTVTSSLANVRVVGNGTLDAGFTGADIGAPAVSGGSWSSAGAYVVDGAGNGIGGTSDQFRFVYKLVSGDMDLVSRISDFQFDTAYQRAGVMVRTTTGATSAHRALLVGPQGLQVVSRATTGATTTVTSAGSRTAPVWLKVSRRGSVITFSHSLDKVTWTQASQQTASGSYYVGLAVTSAAASSAVRAVIDGTALTFAVANQPPTVSLASPAGSVSISGPLAVTATAADSDGSVVSVAFYSNGTLLGTDTTAPFQVTFSTSLLGIYTLKAVAKDNSGAPTSSATRTVTVVGDLAPVVTLLTPLDRSRVVSPAPVVISASATDLDGVQRVEFYNGQTLLGTDLTAPYSLSWTGMPDGIYSITALAYDTRGSVTASSTRDVLVANASLPATALFTPATNHYLLQRYEMHVFAASADPEVAQPVMTIDLGVPEITDIGDVNVDVAAWMFMLPPGQYVAVIAGISGEGIERSDASPPFSR
jgi:regulation of enolase protein 1 (concanavalin A-like superfamily)